VPEGPSSDAVAKTLTKNGFTLVHQRGSHAKFVKAGQPALMVIVPIGRKNLKIGTFRSICRQSGLQPRDFS
jgi:predicted RNA binding protein YcfA (HicA-like mRNA interferase family)